MKKDLPGWIWISLAVICALFLGLIDWITGYELNFFVFYFLPISLAAWYAGREASIFISVFSAVVWFGADALSGQAHSSHFYAVWNTIVRLVSFISIGWTVAQVRHLLDRERQLTEELRRSLSEVKVLEAFLPICSLCKRIRNQEGSWEQLEIYFGEHAGTQFSHGYCPECAKKIMAESGLFNK